MFVDVLTIVVLPALAGAVIIGVCWGSRAIARARWLRDACASALPGLVLAGAFAVAVGVPSLPPEKRWHGLFHMALACAVLGAAVGLLGPGRRAIAMLAAGVLAAGSVWLLDLPDVATGVSAFSVALTIAILAWSAGVVEDSGGGLVMGVTAWAALAGVSVCAVLSNQPSLSMSCGALSALAAAAVVLHGVLGRRRCGVMVIGGVAFGALIGATAMTGWAYDYGDVQWWQWLLTCLGVMAATMCTPQGSRTWTPSRVWLAVVLGVGMPLVGVCSALSMQGAPIGQ